MIARGWWKALLLGVVLLGCGHNGGAGGTPTSDAGPTVAQGAAFVRARQCGECHQSPDLGDGLLSGQATPIPGTRSYGANLTPDPDTGMDAWDAASIGEAVLHGVDNQGAPLCSAMPTYADAGMGSDEALAIAAYLRSLTPVWHSVPASTCGSVVPTGEAGP
jgi:mono/diheme cytochrome c family protein